MYFYKDLFKSKNIQKRCYSIKITILIDQQNTSSVCLKRINDIYYLIVLLKKYVFNTNAQKYLVFLDLNTLRSTFIINQRVRILLCHWP